MKTKKFEKKLYLNKKTIADLNSKEMSYVNGGNLTPTTLTYYVGCIRTRINTNCVYPC